MHYFSNKSSKIARKL